MGYTRRKVKTRRRVKRAKTNTQKQRRFRNQTFRKSRRVTRGGSGKGKSRGMSKYKMEDEGIEWTGKKKSEESGMSEFKMEDEGIESTGKEKPEQGEMAKIEKEDYEQDRINKKKDKKNEKKRLANIKSGLYRRPLYEDSESIIVDQTEQLENTENQRKFMDDMDAEEVPGGPIWFAGKKKRTGKKK
jgi:hypothetical protein